MANTILFISTVSFSVKDFRVSAELAGTNSSQQHINVPNTDTTG